MPSAPRCILLLASSITLLAACAAPQTPPPPTPTVVPTEPPTATPVPPTATATPPPSATPTQTLRPTNTQAPPTATSEPTATPKPTNTPQPAPTKVVTPKPTATRKVAQPPLQIAIVTARDAVEAIGGAMDRIYHGGGGEACAPFMASYLAIVNAPTYDVSAQPANVQAAYAQYRQGVEYLPASKVTQIANICLGGGGTIGNLDFNEARQSVNVAGGLLTQALASLGQ